FCFRAEEEHQATLEMMEFARYDQAFMFIYSERPGTLAAKKMEDDIPEAVKKRRLSEVIALQGRHSRESYQADIGNTYRVLIEGNSKRSDQDFCGRNDQNKMVVFPKNGASLGPGDYVEVTIKDATSATLKGEMVS
ncbi:MAG: TRAM domain-containing protein, partial [Bacteroidota bacterium]